MLLNSSVKCVLCVCLKMGPRASQQVLHLCARVSSGRGLRSKRTALVRSKFFAPELTQRAQYSLIKEYSLNHNMNPLMI